ncbi:MAG: hypothetical protein ACM3XQ_02925, partial [Nocardioidaceae bacterium]
MVIASNEQGPDPHCADARSVNQRKGERMHGDFVVLRDMSAAATTEPFRAGPSTLGVEGVPSEPRIDVLAMDKQEVRDMARDPEVKALARLMPTRLIEPVSDEEA